MLGTSQRVLYSELSHRLTYVSHKESKEADSHVLEIETRDPVSELEVLSRFSIFFGLPVIRCTSTVENKGTSDLYLQTLCPLSIGGLNGNVKDWWKQYRIFIPNSNLFREAQWQSFTLPQLGMDYCGSSDFHLPGTRAAVILSNQGTFSTTGHLPMGALERNDGQECWMWQVEHSGAWRWELGNIRNSLYLAAGGPTESEQWTRLLRPGQSFSSVPVALTLVKGTCDAAFVPMTDYRRRIRRKHADNENLPIIFNDYMNCLMGDPDEEKVKALIQPAKAVGAEYFVIDAGWYADDNGWWDTVGAWEPSTVRFPNGLKTLLSKIKAAGMIPGLWLEPEVMGANSPVANQLPDEAYFQRYGVRLAEQGRYHLDFRHQAVRSRLDGIMDRLITEYGVEYFKLDYNIDVTSGTDVDTVSPGDGMFEHRRAYISWINGIYNRFPQVVLESCSSGGQRLDYHMLATHSIQSTSDQEDAFIYAAIAAAAPTAVTPEQSASWAYPQPEWNDEEIAFTVVNSLLGRVHLSGRIDKLSNAQLRIVKEGMNTYKAIRRHIKIATPFWPLGLHDWHQDWLALGLQCSDSRYVAVWRRGGDESCRFPRAALCGKFVHSQCLFPRGLSFATHLNLDRDTVTVTLPNAPSARLFRFF